MLESSTLLLLPWAGGRQRRGGGPGAGPAPTREIRDADSTGILGFACRRLDSPGAWFSWLARPALDVYAREEEDTSLLFTLYCPWFWTRVWEVYDADEHLVGTLRGNLVLDSIGSILATVERGAGTGGFHFRGHAGYGPTSLTQTEAGVRMAFAPEIASDPFAKMMLLAAGLALTNGQRAEMT
jgi:hypothetical protein